VERSWRLVLHVHAPVIQSLLKCPDGWSLHNWCWQHVPYLDNPVTEETLTQLQTTSLNFLFHSMTPQTVAATIIHIEKCSFSTLSIPFNIRKTWIKSPLVLLFASDVVCQSQSLWIWFVLKPLYCLLIVQVNSVNSITLIHPFCPGFKSGEQIRYTRPPFCKTMLKCGQKPECIILPATQSRITDSIIVQYTCVCLVGNWHRSTTCVV